MKKHSERFDLRKLVKNFVLASTLIFITLYFLTLLVFHRLGYKHLLLPIPSNGHSFAYELRIRKYLLKQYSIKYFGPYFYRDKPFNAAYAFKVNLNDTRVSELKDELAKREIISRGVCYLDGELGSWTMTIIGYDSFSGREVYEALSTCFSDREGQDFYEYPIENKWL